MGSCQSTEAAATKTEPPAAEKPPTLPQQPKKSINVQQTSPQSDSDMNTKEPKSYASHVLPASRPPLAPNTDASSITVTAQNLSARQADYEKRGHFASYASGASTPEVHSSDDEEGSHGSSSIHSGSQHRRASNPKTLLHSSSAIGLDEMLEDRREVGDLRQNMVHIEIPFGKPIEEVYEGVHNGPVLGSGISGLVRLVTHKKTGLKYAVKVLDLALVDTAEGLRQLREEIFIMCQLDHPNIVRLEEVYESHSEIYLVQELCLGGELFDRLDEQPDYHYTEAECARLVKQMLSAVRYLHSKGIIHRDLKLENFLFSSTAKDSELKMIDFGLSKHFRYGEVQHEAVGTPYTVAPEVIRGSYDERCDIWAIGVITFLLLSGDPPFGGCGGPEPLMTVRANILRGAFKFEPAYIWETVSSLARDFISALLVCDPEKRPTARQAQKHAWLQEWASRSRNSGKDNNVLNPNVVKALVNFKEFSDMRKLLCEVLSFTLLPEQIKDLRREFEKMDTDGSGEISLAALKQVLVTNAGAGSLGALTEEEVEDIFNAMRVRKTETRIHWHEFIAAGLSQCQVDDRNLRLAFDRLDADHKGYVTLDDIMDLMGSDALQSEDAIRKMWGDSVKAVKCQHARITYDDFLLLMKGQTKEVSISQENSVSSLVANSSLYVVDEGAPHELDESRNKGKDGVFLLPSGDAVTHDGKILPAPSAGAEVPPDSPNVPSAPVIPPIQFSHSAPSTPAGHKCILDINEIDSPLSMDEDDDLVASSGPGVPGSSASLTPPTSPVRGATDYVTPLGGRKGVEVRASNKLALPGLTSKPEPYQRRRSRSVDDRDEMPGEAEKDLHAVADVVRDMLLPETDHEHAKTVGAVVKDEAKSALAVNRQLYRAHRQLRLSVLEASKRFEEQQAEHAREVILAQREAEGKTEQGMGMIQAGLVMRHGHKKQVSSQAIRELLQQTQSQQQALVEKANRRGGRGRRSRKKTISDMSGMLSSMGQEEMGAIASNASALPETNLPPETRIEPVSEDLHASDSKIPDILSSDGHVRGATVPGEYHSTKDPFGKQGKYGAAAVWKM